MSKKLKNHVLSLLGLSFAAFLFIASASSKQSTGTVQSLVEKVHAKFDFSPPSREKIGSAGITIAMVKPTYVHKNPEYLVPPFNDMASGMASDFDELLIAKGFTIKGPFGSRDEMTFNDKENSSFILEIDIELTFAGADSRIYTTIEHAPSFAESVVNKYARSTYTYKVYGQIILGGKLVIKAKSARYGELLWTKSIDLEGSSFACPGQNEYPGKPEFHTELNQDALVYNTISRELEKLYSKALNLAWQQIDAAEMKTVAAEGKKADKKGN
jgi:hypothetical protein